MEAEDCMLGHSNLCPGAEPLMNFLESEVVFVNLGNAIFK
jgi:hypothetical protein